jgi:nitrite reductase/ring-hydroxylating ferredoxin subunit
VVVRGATRAAATSGLTVVGSSDDAPRHPSVVVVDLDQPGAADLVTTLREKHPEALLVGHLGMPDPERWTQAERAGCDLVANRGALGRQLAERLRAGGADQRRFPLVNESDLAGRIGLVVAVDESPAGPVGVYHVEGQVCVVDDVCPHAGARLSGGVVEGCVVTCPRHGSQFDVRTGERLRGPADREVARHRAVREGGRVQLLTD